jgi:hypothetical protein
LPRKTYHAEEQMEMIIPSYLLKKTAIFPSYPLAFNLLFNLRKERHKTEILVASLVF